MRPQILYALFTNIQSLKGVGPRVAVLYRNLGCEFLVDLLWHLPTGVVDRTYSPPLRTAEAGRIATLRVTVIEHKAAPKRSLPYKVVVRDDQEDLTLTYFNAKGDYLLDLLPKGRTVTVSGTLERYRNTWVMNHPDYVSLEEKAEDIPRHETVYPLTAGLSTKMIRRTIGAALERAPDLPEWIAPAFLERQGWKSWRASVLASHRPDVTTKTDSVTATPPAVRRLAYDELLADQLSLTIIRAHHKNTRGRIFDGPDLYRTQLLASLPFKLTDGQTQAIAEISADMRTSKRMLRLLQGDVGAGKTIVALAAMLQAVEAGSQATLMAPTEILAKQHHAKLSELLAPLSIEVGLLIGKSKSTDRQSTLDGLKTGSLKLVVGTHALFQDDIVFHDLGLAVIDEQHRFGVNQRLLLSEKGNGVDILAMTATPIPRTLTLTTYGDMDVSRITEKPKGRQKIDTSLVDMARLSEVIEGVRRQIAKGAQVYWVCPLVEESELVDLAAATERATLLTTLLQDARVGLIHGKLKTDQKDAVMKQFAAGDLHILVATTVIEVGVDVPRATVMVVEHAERFGLSQLHQLRGRVGRGSEKSFCLLVYQGPLGQTAKARLMMLRETDDGFAIAEEDLRLRGAGELLGVRQSGGRAFRLAELGRDGDLLDIAHDDAAVILAQDPHLETERGRALRTLLYLFNRDAAVPLLRAG